MQLKSLTIAAILLGVLFGALIPATTVLGHHSHAMFEEEVTTTLTGTVTGVRWSNPHVYLRLEADDGSGEVQTWSIEMSHLGNMQQRGYSSDTFQNGTDIVVTVNPLRNGQPGGNYTHVESIDGVTNAADGSSWEPVSN